MPNPPQQDDSSPLISAGGTKIAHIERISGAQARRDRRKIVAAQAEIRALSNKVAMLEGSLSRRAGGPARRAIRLLRRLLNRPGLQDAVAADEARRTTRGLALVIDHHWPQPDRDSGSIDIVNLVQALAGLGFDTILAASEAHDGDQPARDRLIALGVRCLLKTDAASMETFIREQGHRIDVCVMCRVFCGGAFLETLQRHAPQARLIFNSIDLNYLREERRALHLGDENLRALIPQLRAREEHLIRNSDATLVVSSVELDLLGETMPESLVAQMPLARGIHRPAKAFSERKGIGFIGGFSHAPNVDAVRFFLREIWPHVQRTLPECEFSIVGPDAPGDLADGHTNVRILGHLSDVGPWFETLRLTVAPLRFGAGAKGKVASSLSHGIPCILTGVASEGMSLIDTEGVLIRNEPVDFAEAVSHAYMNEVCWRKLSTSGLAYAEQTLSLDAWRGRLDKILELIGL
jgi:glycosyltransferase involved in cell wall biosynthesis